MLHQLVRQLCLFDTILGDLEVDTGVPGDGESIKVDHILA